MQTARPKHGNDRTDTRTGAGVLLLGVPADVRNVARDHRHDAVQAGKGLSLSASPVEGVSTQASNARPRPHVYSMGTVEQSQYLPAPATDRWGQSRTAQLACTSSSHGPCALRARWHRPRASKPWPCGTLQVLAKAIEKSGYNASDFPEEPFKVESQCIMLARSAACRVSVLQHRSSPAVVETLSATCAVLGL